MSREKRNAGLGVGGSSILMVFVIVCLSTFSSLALVSAQADYNLSQKTAQAVTAYYQADGRAVERVAVIDQAILAAAGDMTELNRLLAQEGLALADGEIAFSAMIDADLSLEVAVTLSDDGAEYRITRWQVVNSGQWDGDKQPLNILQGFFD